MAVVSLFAIWKTDDYPGQSGRGKNLFCHDADRSLHGTRAKANANSAPDYLKSVAQFINTGQYTQAINLLNTIEDRNARWYYLSALANAAVGKWNVAQDHIRTAYAKEPDNMTYHQAYSDITNGINPLKKDPFSSFFDFGDMGGAHTYTYTRPNQNKTIYRNI